MGLERGSLVWRAVSPGAGVVLQGVEERVGGIGGVWVKGWRVHG